MAEATKRPWATRIWDTRAFVTGDGMTICSAANKHRNANAELIVRAVNGWDSIESLKARISELEGK